MKKYLKYRYLTVSFFCLISLFSCAQNKEILFNVNWTVGEQKIITIIQNAKEFKNGKLFLDTTIRVTEKIKITGKNDSVYFVDYQMENGMARVGSSFYPSLRNEFSGDSCIVLKCSIHKKNLQVSLLNFHEADSIVDNNYNQIIKILEKKSPDKLSEATTSLDTFHTQLKSSLFTPPELLSVLLISYNKKYMIGDTIEEIDTLSNPFKFKDFNGAKIKTYISSGSGKEIHIRVDKTYDFTAYKLKMKEMYDKMSHEIQPKTESNEQLSNVMFTMLNSFDFDANETMTIYRKLNYSWPLKIVKQIHMNVKDPNNETSIEMNFTTEIK